MPRWLPAQQVENSLTLSPQRSPFVGLGEECVSTFCTARSLLDVQFVLVKYRAEREELRLCESACYLPGEAGGDSIR